MTAPLPEITAPEAMNRHWDVVIAGSSFASMFFLKGLPPDLSVLIVEKGQFQPHQDQTQVGIFGLEQIAQNNHSDHRKDWVAHTTFGGNSNCWWACTPRFHPNDFRMDTAFGVGQDWPLSYDDLAPFYEEVEETMEIAGGGSDHILPRRAPFPFPPHLPSRSDTLLRAGSDNWFAQPTARANGGARAQCCANGVCTICPVNAKFTIENGIDHFARADVHLLQGAEARAVRIEAGTATGLMLRHDGAEIEINGTHFAIGANAIFNAAILLRSGIDNDQIGAGINEQLARYAIIDAPGLGYWGGTSITGHGYDLYDGPHRAEVSAALMEVYNAPARFRHTPGRWGERVQIKLIVEDLPQDQNRVMLVDNEPVIDWHGHHDYALNGLDRAVEQLPSILPFEAEAIEFTDLVATEAHILGTHRMGVVTDDLLAVRNVGGLHALGGGNFTTSSPANPTLTLSALSLRAGRSLS